MKSTQAKGLKFNAEGLTRQQVHGSNPPRERVSPLTTAFLVILAIVAVNYSRNRMDLKPNSDGSNTSRAAGSGDGLIPNSGRESNESSAANLAPGMGFMLESVQFGDQEAGTSSTVRIRLTAFSAALQLKNLEIKGEPPVPFVAHSTSVGQSVFPGENAIVEVTFTPRSEEEFKANLLMTSDAPGSPHIVKLLGRGVSPPAPEMTVTPGRLVFSDQRVGTPSSGEVRVTNRGSAVLQLNDLEITGESREHFSVAARTPVSEPIFPGKDSVIEVTFIPRSEGEFTANLRLSSNAPGSPHTVQLVGKGATKLRITKVVPPMLLEGRKVVERPPNADDSKCPGPVRVDVTILRDGSVGEVYVERACNDLPLRRAVEETVKQWKYTPGIDEYGERREVDLTVIVELK